MSVLHESSGVDFHCHLDLFPDHEEVIARAEAARVYTLSVTTTPKAWPRNYELTRHTQYVRAALGLHPQLVASRAVELALWEKYLPQTRYIGEVGLDASPRVYRSLDVQIPVFQRILERCAEAGGKILTVHSLRSVRTVLDMLERSYPRERGAVVLHWFTGTKSEARRAIELGCYFSVNGAMTRSGTGRALIEELPSDRLLTETDGPFTKIANCPAEPANVYSTIGELARLRSVPVDTMGVTLLSNLRTLLFSDSKPSANYPH